jgi:hypothetical protein
VENLRKPLLSHAWSPGFSFAKCHLEESAPYDGFAPYITGAEAFSRYARFWTRGYDVYTPTRNIIFHNYNPNPDGHGVMEWDKPMKKWIKAKSLNRIRSYLEIPDAPEPGLKLDNFGIYGLGKRRSLKQLNEFVGIDLAKQQSRPDTVGISLEGLGMVGYFFWGNLTLTNLAPIFCSQLPCGAFQWVPYDNSISPVENLYANPDDLDPQPEFPLRTELTFFKEVEVEMPDLEVLVSDLHSGQHVDGAANAAAAVATLPPNDSDFPSFISMFLLWIVGLLAWLYYTIQTMKTTSPAKRTVKTTSNPGSYKDK